jgi:hypothetical protein
MKKGEKRRKKMNFQTKFALLIRGYVLPIVIIIGTISNTLSFIVMRRMNSTIISFYMSILAIADTSNKL